MKRSISIFLSFGAGLFLFSSCDKGSDNIPIDKEEKVNEWIYTTMVDNYLWYDEIEDKSKSSYDFNNDTEAFFKSLLSKNDGKVFYTGGSHVYFSYIEEKRNATKAVSEVEPTYGFDYIAYNVSGTNYYYCRVLYVLPNSPAEEAGLLRDDWIFGINTKDNHIKDFSVLDGGNEITLFLGELDVKNQKLRDKGPITIPAARIINNNPFFKDSVYHIGGKTIGYLLYNHFSAEAEGASDGAYDKQMKSIFANFKSEGVNEFVLDLRFNGGGLVTSAVLLSSLLAPSADLGKVFCELIYNQKKSSSYNRKINLDKSVISSNLNLNRLYVLTGQWTASASEAVINGLRPYMEVNIIGDKTVGKAVGSNPYGEKDDYGWILHPITLKICNAEGKADYSQVGFDPNTYIYEFETQPYIKLYPLGDTKEILFATALEKMGVIQTKAEIRSSNIMPTDASLLSPIYSSIEQRNPGGLIVPLPEE